MTEPPTSSAKATRPGAWQPPTAEELQAMLPDYEITLLLGRGGMGAVYKGVQRNLDRPVAIKILPPDLADAEGNYADRFRNEARAMARMNHYGIVKVYDFGEVRGLLYFVMEFIEGTDVSRMIARKGRLPADHALAITAHVCDALQYAHERGIIHRDIKPANIMVGQDGVVKVADFGLAKMAEGGHSGLTRSGMAMGTLHYMAPEALTLGSAVDQRADIYAVGVMFYHMLAGRLPQGVFEPLHRQFPELDPRYDDIVARAMRDDRELRYPSAAALRADLDSLLTRPVMQVVAPEKTPATSPAAGRSQQEAQEPEHDLSEDHWQHSPPSAPRSKKNWMPWAALIVLGGTVAWLMMDHTAPKPDSAQAKPAQPLLPPFTNSLGMKFVSVPGTEVQFCVHETRRQDYAAYAAAVPGVDASWKAAKYDGVPCGDQDNHPIVAVSWEDAQGFCAWLSKKEGRVFRLPSDAEWSLAAGLQGEDSRKTPEERGAQNRGLYPWGKDWPPPPKTGNFADTSTVGQLPGIKEHIPGYSDGFMTTCRVMAFPANAFGLHDLEGNVSEWTADWFNSKKERRAVRGGSWAMAEAGHLLAARRSQTVQTLRYPSYGFRVVVEAAAPFPALPPVAEMKTLPAPVTNSLGMRFVPVPGTDILMCVHETRRRDYAPYHAAVPGVDQAWKSTDIYGVTFKDDENLPVMRVSWEDAMLYSDWLGKKEGRVYRLPTDREWSHAVGIGADEAPFMKPGDLDAKITDVYPWGTDWPPPAGAGNYADTEAQAKGLPHNPKILMKGILEGYNDGFATLAPVMHLKPNALGLHDLGGNLQEWCLDWYDDRALHRVTRGAGWNRHEKDVLLSSTRAQNAFDARGVTIGFRLVLVPDAKPPAPVPLKTLPHLAFTNTLGMKFVPVPGTDICMCVHETRRGDFAKFAAENPAADASWRGSIAEGAPENRGDDFAVGAMSWNDATAFCAWLSKKEGRTYRLPTDREWSCAVGIGQDEPPGYSGSVLKNRLPGVYPWGKFWPPKSPVENFADTASKAKFPPGNKMGLTAFIDGYTDGFPTTARVMSFPPNALGIYDLGGNVREWCADHGSSATTGRVMRGGCWKSNDVGDTVSAFRFIREPDKRSSEYGFRIVAEPLPAVAPAATTTTETKSPGGAPTPAKPAAVPPTPTAPANTAPTKPSSAANTPASSMPTTPAKTWTDIQGRSITATFKAIASGNVLLEIAGKVTPVPLNTLSAESQELARSLAIELAATQQGVAGKPFDAITLEDITKDRNLLKQDRIDASDSRVLKAGTILIYQTCEGRYGKARVESPAHHENNGRLTLSWCTFGADGKIHSSVMSLVIPSLASFDLDSGTVGRNGEDLRWGLQSPGKPYLARTGDSLLAVLPSSDALTDTPSSNLPSVKPVAVQPPVAPVTSTTAGTLMPPTPVKAPKQTVKIDRLPTSGWRPLVEKWSTIEETHPGVKRKGRETVLQPGTVLAFQGTRNAAVRMRLVYGAFNEPDLKLRWEPEAANNRAYATSADQTRASLTLEKPLTGSGEYPEAFIPSPYLIVGQEYEIALSAVGQTLCLFVNGKRIAEHDLANDPTTGSMLGVTADAGRHEQTFRDIEWCPLADEGKPLPRSAVIPGVP